MKVIIVARQLGIYSEHWLKRQIELLKADVEQVLVMGDCDLTELYGVPVRSLALEYQIKYKVLSKVFRKDILEYKRSKLEHLLSKSQCDTILFHYIDFTLNFKDVIKRSNKDCFVYCHGYDVTWDLRKSSNPREASFSETYKTDVLDLSKDVCFIANSANTVQKLRDIGVSEAKIRMKHFGIEHNDFRKLPEYYTLLYLGRLVDFKGPHLVLKAFEMACAKGMKAKLIFAGDGALRETLELMRLVSDYKEDIEILGAVDYNKAQELFKHASVFVAHNCIGQLTGQEEAFGVSIIEAMSFGIPVITGASGGTKETVVHNETGFLFQPFDVEAQANYFLNYYNDTNLMSLHSRNAQKHVREHFSLENEQCWYNEIFEGDDNC
ncbi:glycosyltransferase family 4 protein [Mangrovimonas sp. YM274]|uniref:glycosyltransferase family 4 protein n=1 Tax=Mangrovimonas sp. YM274 TaxID=3070660 RepID=UPI0027DC97E9|nr:glycosyltransferase family 4 protein [Mangrovimonas sp. YM274]WMI68456.1 glycosyltransferase family 4 protein [Mangrovimonas sp. YM274]